jgi:hypothetical protein
VVRGREEREESRRKQVFEHENKLDHLSRWPECNLRAHTTATHTHRDIHIYHIRPPAARDPHLSGVL